MGIRRFFEIILSRFWVRKLILRKIYQFNFICFLFLMFNILKIRELPVRIFGESFMALFFGIFIWILCLLRGLIVRLREVVSAYIERERSLFILIIISTLEIFSNFRRTLRLGFRLYINLSVGCLLGHLLFNLIRPWWFFNGIIFFILERIVIIVQAYVFILLSGFYWTEF